MSLVMLFPGQGAQAVGMGAELYRSFPIVKEVFEQASDNTGIDFAALCFKGPRLRLNSTEFTQPAIYTLSYATYRLLTSYGITPTLTAGHSLGEFTALTAAGCFEFSNALALVSRRASLMAHAFNGRDGAMAAIENAPEELLADWCETLPSLWIANLNAPSQTVLSGASAAIDAVCEQARTKDVKATRLPVSGAFHTPLLGEVADAFCNHIDSLPIEPPTVTVIGNVSGRPLTTSAEIREELKAHMRSPVQWVASMRYANSQGDCPSFVEVGPGRILKGLLLKNLREATCFTTETSRDMKLLLRHLECA